MQHAAIIDKYVPEPRFEPPPCLIGIHDRRLSVRVAAEWVEHQQRRAATAIGAKVPRWPAYGDAFAPQDERCIWLTQREGGVALTSVGGLVGQVFAVKPGVADGSPFVRALANAFARSIADAEPVRFEGGFARHAGATATLLTRGVVVLIADEAGGRRGCAVVSWTETLTAVENSRLQRELFAALRETPVRLGRIASSAIW